MSTHRYALFAAALFAAAPAAALAQPGPGNPPGGPQGGRGQGAMFERIDSNRDGRVTMDEVWVFVQGRFNAADADRNGGLTQAELQQAMRGMGQGQQGGRRADGPDGQAAGPGGDRAARGAEHAAMMFRMLDADRDGQVTLVEIRPMVEARFRGLDANNDGAVERSEMPQRQAGHHHRHGGPGRGAPAAPANPG